MEFHISRAVREATKVDDLLFSYTGNVVFADVGASRRLAEALNRSRNAGARDADADPAGTINAGALFAMGLIDELSHALVERYRKQIDPAVLAEAVRWFAAQVEPAKVEHLLLAFTAQFPNVAIFRGDLSAEQWLLGVTDGRPNREAALEELLMLWMANSNPAFKPFHALFEDKVLKQQTVYANVTAAFPGYFSTRPKMAPEIGSLYDALRAPMLASPDSLIGQLDYIRERWAPYLGDELKRILLAVDILPSGCASTRPAPTTSATARRRGVRWASSATSSSVSTRTFAAAATHTTTRPRSTSMKTSAPTRPGCRTWC
jgi:hypothetical protein